MIQLHDKQFVPFISAKEIDLAITKLVTQISADYSGETPVFIGVLNGAFMVVSDLLKRYTSPCEVSFIKMASYREYFFYRGGKAITRLESRFDRQNCNCY